MGAFKDLKGRVFGRYVVQKQKGFNKRGKALWECLCECGTIKIVPSGHLLSGNTKSCGCLNRQLISERMFKNLVEKVFERLLVLEHVGFDKWGSALWACLCKCGNVVIISGSCLLSGNTKSCGCLKIEVATERLLKLNTVQKRSAHPRWKGGITPESAGIRKSSEYKTWRKAIFKRDNYTCQSCNQRGGKLHAHHVKKFSDYLDLRFDINNGQTLCINCHHKPKDNYNKASSIETGK